MAAGDSQLAACGARRHAEDLMLQQHQHQVMLHGRRRRRRCRLRNETLFVLSLIQGLCASAALILCAVAFSTRGPVLPAMADSAAALLVLCVSAHGVVTSRRKTYCTVLTLFVLCQLACLAGVVLLVTSSAGLHRTVTALPPAAGPADAPVPASDLVIAALTLLIGLLQLGVAFACCLVCARQLCHHDARIALDPRGRGLIVLEDPATQLPPPPQPPPPFPPPPRPPGYFAVVVSVASASDAPPPAYAP